MAARIEVIGGARAGTIVELPPSGMEVGRSPESGLQLDPHHDLQVSGRHARLSRTLECWVIEDVGSRNGTLVNGHRITGPVQLRDGDLIQFGAGGPKARFVEPAPVLTPAGAEAHGPVAAPPDTPRPPDSGLTRVIRARVAQATVRLRLIALVLASLLFVTVVTTVVTVRASAGAWERELGQMRVQLDSIVDASERMEAQLRGESAGLAGVLERSREQLSGVQQRLSSVERADRQRDGLDDLRRELLAAQTALRRQQLAANVDYAGIEGRSTPAVARIFSELEGGRTVAATAFAVDASGLLVTTQHVVENEDGSPATRLGIRFSGSSQVFPARIVATSSETDLAIVRMERLVGTVPTIGSLNASPDTIVPGRPIVVLGFPLGGRAASPTADESESVARPITSVGILSAATSTGLELEAYGAEGSSGSPILDETGEVIGVLFGGRDVDGQRRLLATPSSVLLRLLGQL